MLARFHSIVNFLKPFIKQLKTSSDKLPPRFTKHFHLPLFDFSVIKKKGKQEMLVVELQTMRSFLYHQLNAQKNGRKEKIVIIANISSISAQFCAIWWDLQDAFYVEHKLFPNRESDSLCQTRSQGARLLVKGSARIF